LNSLTETMIEKIPVTHRFSTVISTDRIVVDVTHDELIKTSDVYKRLYETQLMGVAEFPFFGP